MVLTEMPETAAVGPASAAGSAVAAARVRPERSRSRELSMDGPSGGTVGGTSHAPPGVGKRPCCLNRSQRPAGHGRTRSGAIR
ncbi:hypothetical protein Srubr_03990 [Streptomyces rubradiris]|uniref:Uncharacterized protein n=1 Tax=Streptomyces rubradiris TaxID=285531 RepID=A0ABQ3R3X8_STRRR|nr:hypothetical protein GCM10018792_23050 [Streptomyces rubradiris]GHI50553.1 hypothetical protein Srubr_03990 [Streptomyces rubradiris]